MHVDGVVLWEVRSTEVAVQTSLALEAQRRCPTVCWVKSYCQEPPSNLRCLQSYRGEGWES